MYSKEEKPNKQIIWLTNLSVMVAILLWMVAISGIMPATQYSNHSFFRVVTETRYYILDAVSGTLMFILAAIVNHWELKRVNNINKPWNVKPPEL